MAAAQQRPAFLDGLDRRAFGLDRARQGQRAGQGRNKKSRSFGHGSLRCSHCSVYRYNCAKIRYSDIAAGLSIKLWSRLICGLGVLDRAGGTIGALAGPGKTTAGKPAKAPLSRERCALRGYMPRHSRGDLSREPPENRAGLKLTTLGQWSVLDPRFGRRRRWAHGAGILPRRHAVNPLEVSTQRALVVEADIGSGFGRCGAPL